MPIKRLQRTRDAYHGVLDIGCLCGLCCGERGRRKFPEEWASPLMKHFLEGATGREMDWFQDPDEVVVKSTSLTRMYDHKF
jgi:hypothetical protein